MTNAPEWLAEARRNIGVREVAGPKHSPTILGWAKRLGSRVLGIAVLDDETAWCGTFAAHCVSVAGHKPPPIAVRASAWSAFGQALPVNGVPPLGAVAVFKRPGGGHVGFVVGVDPTAYHVLGGNQSNAVNVQRIARERCVALRWPTGVPLAPPAPRLSGGGGLSQNEA